MPIKKIELVVGSELLNHYQIEIFGFLLYLVIIVNFYNLWNLMKLAIFGIKFESTFATDRVIYFRPKLNFQVELKRPNPSLL